MYEGFNLLISITLFWYLHYVYLTCIRNTANHAQNAILNVKAIHHAQHIIDTINAVNQYDIQINNRNANVKAIGQAHSFINLFLNCFIFFISL